MDLQARCPQRLLDGLPDGLLEAVSSLVGSMSFCCPPRAQAAVLPAPPPVMLLTSVFWMEWERSGSLRTAGEARCSLTHFHFPPGEKLPASWQGLSWHWAVPLWKRSNVGKIILFLLPSSCVHSWYFPSMMHWSFSVKLLDFPKSTLTRGQLSKLCSSWGRQKTIPPCCWHHSAGYHPKNEMNSGKINQSLFTHTLQRIILFILSDYVKSKQLKAFSLESDIKLMDIKEGYHSYDR